MDALYAPRRTLLDPLLADAARASGAEVAYRVRLKELQRDVHGRVNGVVLESGRSARPIAADIVIGADSVNSTVAKRVAAEPYRVGRHMSKGGTSRSGSAWFSGCLPQMLGAQQDEGGLWARDNPCHRVGTVRSVLM